MPTRRRWITLSLAAVTLTAAAAAGARAAGEDLMLESAWMRATPANAKVAGAFVTITNRGPAADRLVGGEASFAGRVEIHEMTMQDGIMRMRELAEGLEIPPGETVVLQPGGYHVMFMELAEPLVEGEIRKAMLRFAEAGVVELDFRVASLGARSAPEAMGD